MHSPLDQFIIKRIINIKLFGVDVSLTNSSLFMIVSTVLCLFLLWLAVRKATVIPSKKQVLAEVICNFISGTLHNNAGKRGMKYFPEIFSVFMYILSCNLMGLLPYSFTATSHITITFALAMFIICFITIVGILNNGLSFFRVFLPRNIPCWLAPLIIIIEIVAYFSRAASLSIRLAGNMIAGHTMLKVITGFVISLNVFFAIVPFNFLVILNIFEFLIAILQAYIFTILSCVYLDSTLNTH